MQRNDGKVVVVSLTRTVRVFGPFESHGAAVSYISANAVENAAVVDMVTPPHVYCSANKWCERTQGHDGSCLVEGQI